MTKEEIINGLKMSMDLTLFDPSTGEVMEPWQLNDINRTAYEAYKGAIELLEKQPDTTTDGSNVVKKGGNDEDRTSGDCINRRASLEKIRTMQTYKLFAGDDMLLIDQAEAQTELMMLPPAQPVQRWVPCSERLPEIDKEVLVTDGDICWVCSLFDSQDIEDGLYLWEDNYGHWHEFEEWVAWMPLPEIYQEGGEHK